MPFLTVVAIIGNQASRNGGCQFFPSLCLDWAEIKLLLSDKIGPK